MNYKETTAWMFSRLPMYQQQGGAAYKEDLSRTLKLSAQLNYPERKFKSVHVGGTNGKGSTAHMIAAILQEAGSRGMSGALMFIIELIALFFVVMGAIMVTQAVRRIPVQYAKQVVGSKATTVGGERQYIPLKF